MRNKADPDIRVHIKATRCPGSLDSLRVMISHVYVSYCTNLDIDVHTAERYVVDDLRKLLTSTKMSDRLAVEATWPNVSLCWDDGGVTIGPRINIDTTNEETKYDHVVKLSYYINSLIQLAVSSDNSLSQASVMCYTTLDDQLNRLVQLHYAKRSLDQNACESRNAHGALALSVIAVAMLALWAYSFSGAQVAAPPLLYLGIFLAVVASIATLSLSVAKFVEKHKITDTIRNINIEIRSISMNEGGLHV